MKILITGCAGFIGSHLTAELIKKKHLIIGVDNLNNYYDPVLKKKRLGFIKNKNFLFIKSDITNYNSLNRIVKKHRPLLIINLAAIAGVRHSLENPRAYINNNILGFFNILEVAKNNKIKKVFYASSSSVYGHNTKYPFSEKDKACHPASLYGATKITNETLAYSYSHIYQMKIIGPRFFTVYGPWGRPDMALFKFVKLALSKKNIPVYNKGKMFRNFTYIDDVVKSIEKLINYHSLKKNKKKLYEIYNIGNNKSVPLMNFVNHIQKALKIKIKIKYLGMQKGDIVKSRSDQSKLFNEIKFRPQTAIKTGIKKFIEWYTVYNKIK